MSIHLLKETMTIELKNYSLIKPLYSFPILTNEDSLGYLHRLAHTNHYDSYAWLIPTELRIKATSTKPSMALIEQLLIQTNWVQYDERSALSQSISNINSMLRGSLTKVRFCPHCISEQSYIRATWVLSSSTVCLKHQALLVDHCRKCHSNLTVKQILTGGCLCGENFNNYPLIYAEPSYLQIQNFIQNSSLHAYDTEDMRFAFQLYLPTLEDRLRLIHFMKNWLIFLSDGPKLSLNTLSIAIELLKKLSQILFTTRRNFINFLDELIDPTKNEDNKAYSLFIKFYRRFYKAYPSDYNMIYYKRIIESYYRDHCIKQITRKNTLFSAKLKDDQKWLTFKQVCRHYHIEPYVLRSMLQTHNITMVEEKKRKRTFQLYHRNSIEDHLDIMNAKATLYETAEILGVTKKQLYQLIKTGIITATKFNSHWDINQYDLDALLSAIYKKYILFPRDHAIAMPDALKKIGNKIEFTLPKIITAILDGTIRIRMKSTKPEGFRGIGLHQLDLEKFILLHTQQPTDCSSIPDLARSLSINQEFAYQLVNSKLLEYTMIGNTRYVSNQNLYDFKEKYIILAHYCAQHDISSSYVIKLLTYRKHFPIDHNWPQKLRQKVYLRTDIDKLSHTTLDDINAAFNLVNQ